MTGTGGLLRKKGKIRESGKKELGCDTSKVQVIVSSEGVNF